MSGEKTIQAERAIWGEQTQSIRAKLYKERKPFLPSEPCDIRNPAVESVAMFNENTIKPEWQALW